MTAKDELRQALLNTCSISDEALTLLNGILNGSGGGGGGTGGALMVQVTTEDDEIYTFDKTANEILAAFVAGQTIIVHFPDGMYSIDSYSTVIGIHTMLNGENKQYYVRVFWGGNMEDFVSHNADGYPEISFA